MVGALVTRGMLGSGTIGEPIAGAPLPFALRATTVQLIAVPTSAFRSLYVCALETVRVPRRQRYAKLLGAPRHLPCRQPTVRPCCAVPLIDGRVRLTGLAPGGGTPAAGTIGRLIAGTLS